MPSQGTRGLHKNALRPRGGGGEKKKKKLHGISRRLSSQNQPELFRETSCHTSRESIRGAATYISYAHTSTQEGKSIIHLKRLFLLTEQAQKPKPQGFWNQGILEHGWFFRSRYMYVHIHNHKAREPPGSPVRSDGHAPDRVRVPVHVGRRLRPRPRRLVAGHPERRSKAVRQLVPLAHASIEVPRNKLGSRRRRRGGGTVRKTRDRSGKSVG